MEDSALLAAFKESGDINLLSTLYQRYMDLVFGVCLKYLKDPDKSKDAVMDIFEELYKKLKKYEVDNFKGWLHTLAKNYCLMQLRSPRNIRTVEFDADYMQSQHPRHLPNEMFEKEEIFRKLEQCMKILPEDQKWSIELFFVQKKCYNEIAEITGYKWDKVRSYIQNGKRNLKICLDKQVE